RKRRVARFPPHRRRHIDMDLPGPQLSRRNEPGPAHALCLLWWLGINAIFVFDGAARPSWKRGKIVRPAAPAVARFETECESLIELFGFAVHRAYGEAEAECAVMQRLGHVDLILTDDVDAFLFGASAVMRNWSTEGNQSSCVTKSKDIRDSLDL